MGKVVLQNGAALFYYKLGQLIYYKRWRRYCKMGQLLQIRATVITHWGSYYKSGQSLLQIGAAITNWGNYYKLGHKKVSMVRQLVQGSVSYFWPGTYPKDFNKDSNRRTMQNHCTIGNIIGWYSFDWKTLQEALMRRDILIYVFQNLHFTTNLKNLVLQPKMKN